MNENLLQTIDKYKHRILWISPNRWHTTDDEKSYALSVNDKYNYSKFFKLYNAIEVDKRSAITLSAIDKKKFSLPEGELAQIKQETADTLIYLRAVTQKINSFFDFLPISDSRTYISPLNTASVFLQSGKGILNFLYADFDSAYSECLKHTRKTCPTRQVLIFPY